VGVDAVGGGGGGYRESKVRRRRRKRASKKEDALQLTSEETLKASVEKYGKCNESTGGKSVEEGPTDSRNISISPVKLNVKFTKQYNACVDSPTVTVVKGKSIPLNLSGSDRLFGGGGGGLFGHRAFGKTF
jgi:hypothetical protein